MEKKQERPAVHMIGNAHLDPVWLWRWYEGYHEAKATYRSALDRMKEDPDYIFTSAAAVTYKWVEESDPEMFAEIQQRVKEGRWCITGGWWVQPDCNIPSGESFVRHALYSQRYFLDRFGVMARVGYNVDSFGHNGALPQILMKSGLESYVFMRPGPHEKNLPGHLFWWEGIDGTRILTFRIIGPYCTWEGDLVNQISRVRELAETEDIDLMCFYGVGNHGGGPTKENLASIRQAMAGDNGDGPVIRYSSPEIYFDEIRALRPDIPVVRDDLQHHASGCYAAHSQVKAMNRRLEHELEAAEKLAAMANVHTGMRYPAEAIQRAWENVLFNQFHDIMAGTSIEVAYDDASAAHGESRHLASEVMNRSAQTISWNVDTGTGGRPFVVFNPNSWDMTVPVELDDIHPGHLVDANGQAVQVQRIQSHSITGRGASVFVGSVPALGYHTYMFTGDDGERVRSPGQLRVNLRTLENDWFRLEVDPETGGIGRLYDKHNQVEVLDGPGAVPVVVDDASDTWSHGVFHFHDDIGHFGDPCIRVVESGPVRARIRVDTRYNNSQLRLDYILYRDVDIIEMRVAVDWHEHHKLLKLSFPVAVDEPRVRYEIPFGSIERPANGEEEPGHRWVDVSGSLGADKGEVYGLAVLNDAKYSYDVLGSDLRLTVLRSPIYAHHDPNVPDPGVDYSYIDQGRQAFTCRLVPHKGDWSGAGLTRKAYELNMQPLFIAESSHSGSLPKEMRGIKVDPESVIASVVKQAEDGGGIIVRCYESSGKPAEARIELPLLGTRQFKAVFSPFEIKTFLVPADRSKPVIEVNLLEMDSVKD